MSCATIIEEVTGSRWDTGVSLIQDNGDAYHAQLTTLEYGLHNTWLLGFRDITWYSDCMDVVCVFSSQVDVSNYWANDTIVCQGNALTWRRHIVSREKNNVVDCLAKQASRNCSPRLV